MAKAPTGRPPGSSTLLTAELTKRICDRLEIAVPEKWAAEEHGIDEGTFHSWMRKGAAGVEPYVAFREAVTRAKAKAVSNLHVRALAGGKGSSQATWMLERRYWRDYAEHKRVEITPTEPPLGEQDIDEAIAEQRKRVAEYERVRNLLATGIVTEGE
jgi:hypothetical protein